VLAGIAGAVAGVVFLFAMVLPPAEAALFACAVGAVAGVLVRFARSGVRHPWSAALFLPGLYLLQVPAIHLALVRFPHDRWVHVAGSLAAGVPLLLLVGGLRRLRAGPAPVSEAGPR
jgi:hypothetical protein